MAVAFATAIVACVGDEAAPSRVAGDTSKVPAAIAPAPPSVPRAVAPTDQSGECQPTGRWAECSVLYRLERAGFGFVRDSAPATEESFAIPGSRLAIGGGELLLFIYADSAARRTVQWRLDPERFITPEGAITHRGERVVIASDNLLAIMKVADPRSRDRIADALLAGPPPPDSRTP